MERIYKVLAVDDEQVVLDSIKKHLRKGNFDVVSVLTANEGFLELEKGEVDIVLTDLMMPGTDGMEFMQEVKKRYPDTPVVMITGYATINTALQAMQLGAFDYIAKPFSRAELHGVVNRAAELVNAAGSNFNKGADGQGNTNDNSSGVIKAIGEFTWLKRDENGLVQLGVEHVFLKTIGRIQSVYLPKVSDKIRQGSVFFQIFTTDLRSHTLLSPLSGEVVKVNEKIYDQPDILDDPYDKGWLIWIDPERYDDEIKILEENND